MPQDDAPMVLLVEDYPDTLNFLAITLENEGYRVLTATTAEKAVDEAISWMPDLILMDLGLPGIDGLSAIWRIREEPILQRVPIIVITAHDSYDLRAEAASAGCRGYVVKPIDMDILKELVKDALGR